MDLVDKIKRGDDSNNGSVSDPDMIISFKSDYSFIKLFNDIKKILLLMSLSNDDYSRTGLIRNS